MGETLRIRAATIVHGGETIELTSGPIPDDTPKAVVDQLRAEGALVDKTAETAPPEVPTLAENATDEQVTAFVAEANSKTVVAAAGSDVELAKRLLAAEQARDEPRKGVVDGLTKITEQ